MASAFGGNEAHSNLMGYVSQMEHRLSDRTKREYTARLKEISKKIPLSGDTLTPDMLIGHIRGLVADGRIASSTYRAYKSAITFWLGQQTQAVIAGGGNPIDYARAFEILKSLKYSQTAASPERTSAKKLKYFPDECLEALTKYSEERGNRAPNAARAVAFAKANLLVGLRPSEWFNATVASRLATTSKGDYIRDSQGRLKFDTMLIVENAKATHGRGNGQHRELVLHGITAEELTSIVYFLKLAREEKERHPAGIDGKSLSVLFYQPMNSMIRRSLMAVGYAERDIPSIYSTRHQAVANFKASGVSKREIAAFFGHSSDYTHDAHYGHKRFGNRNVLFRPSPECLSRVKNRSITRQPETIPQHMVTDVASWIAARDSRKGPDYI